MEQKVEIMGNTCNSGSMAAWFFPESPQGAPSRKQRKMGRGIGEQEPRPIERHKRIPPLQRRKAKTPAGKVHLLGE
ncbi:hypothetical protein NDU88_007761 [Pleurodeles waltl]|uniref:Uncharacterized protein n=1 Tax=Pleurodeles waltl TaxID=8319 RepID=A0AAV7VTH6_PLEWA|nr:hypothetical protein NDU88_007761 [Pleurodeles waltl]